MPAVKDWTNDNLAMQGYCFSAHESDQMQIGLRFSVVLCLTLVTVAVAFQSAAALYAMSAIGLLAGFGPRHPFDYLWNHAVRRLTNEPPIPPNPQRRRHSFKIATALLLTVATLFAVGANTAAVVLGIAVIVACAILAVANLCLPSFALHTIARLRGQEGPYRQTVEI